MEYPKIAEELIGLAEHDLAVREKLLAQGALSQGYHPEMEAVHRANSSALQRIITEIGYPTISKVGNKASGAAWLIVQHAIGEPDFMEACFLLMVDSRDDLDFKNIAYLHDRIQVYKSQPQKYGTQLIAEDTLYPVVDIYRLNEYRLSAGLPKLTDHQLQLIPGCEQIKHIDEQDPGYNVWRRQVGWIKGF